MESLSNIKYIGKSSVGKIRTNNEDNFFVEPIWENTALLAIVADGLGGCEGGEIASKMAVDSIVNYLKLYKNGVREELLRQALINANNAIIEAQLKDENVSQMGTVITVALIDPETRSFDMAHVGDTRLYQFTNADGLVKLSHDHTIVGYKEEHGELTEEEAMNHPIRNVISKLLGSNEVDVNSAGFVETKNFPLLPESILLLCSDGLFDMITSSKIAEILSQNISLEDKANLLIQEANDAGGKDNVTVVLVENTDTKQIEPQQKKTTHNENQEEKDTTVHTNKTYLFRALFVIIVLCVGIIIGIIGQRFFQNNSKKAQQADTLVINDTIVVSQDTVTIDSLKERILQFDSAMYRIGIELDNLKNE